MTALKVRHDSRKVDTATPRLPGPSDDAGWGVGTVNAIAAGVDLAAHALAHPVPQHACPFGGCAGVQVPYRNPSSELTWIEDARVSPVRREVAA